MRETSTKDAVIGHGRPAAAYALLVVTLAAGATVVSTAAEREGRIHFVRSATNDHPVVLMPRYANAPSAAEVDGVRLSVEVENGFRVYRATRAGQTRTAHEAITGPRRYWAYNPKRHRFERLSPAVRVELDDYDLLPGIVQAVGGTDSKIFSLLGFAVVNLPEELNPHTALQSIVHIPGVVSAHLVARNLRRVPR